MLKYKDYCIELLESGLNEVNVSLHGSHPRLHDALTRSPGSFEQAYVGLRNVIALKRDYPLTINTNFTVTKLNYKDIHDYLALLLSLEKIDGIVLNTLMITGNAALFFKQLFVSYTDVARQVRAAVKRLCRRQGRAALPVTVTPMPLCLMRGHEGYVGVQEVPMEVKENTARVLRRSGGLEKGARCRGCRHEGRCAGIDSYYARSIGWSEFRPSRERRG